MPQHRAEDATELSVEQAEDTLANIANKIYNKAVETVKAETAKAA